MTKKRIFVILLAIVMTLSLAACAGSPADKGTTTKGPSEGAPVRDTLRMAITGDYGTFDTTDVSGGNWWSVMACILEPLWDVIFDENGEMQMVWLLATSIEEISPTNWIIHLREGVKFSNGNPFTADDVLFSIDHEFNRPGGGIRAQSMDYENTKKIDDYTIDMRFIEYNAQVKVAYSDMSIFDAESYADTDWSKDPVGTGPYKLTEYVSNSHVYLTRRDDYYGELPQIKNIEFKVLAESSQIVNALETGEVDVASISSQDYETVAALDGYTVVDNDEASWSEVEYNLTENSIFHDVNARMAVAHAIDRFAILNLVYNGHGEVMNSVVSSRAFDYEPRFDNLHPTYQDDSFNLDLAREYAAKAGIKEGTKVVMITNGTAEYVLLAEVVQGMLKEIGLDVEIRNYDVGSFADYRTDYTAYDLALYSGICPNKFTGDTLFMLTRYSTLYGPNNPGAFEGWDRYMEIMADSLCNPDEKVRSDVLYELQQIWANANIRYSLVQRKFPSAYSTDLEGPFLFRASQQRRVQDFKFKTN